MMTIGVASVTLGLACAAVTLAGQSGFAAGSDGADARGGKHAPYVASADREPAPANAIGYWFAGDDILCARTLGGTPEDTSRASLVVPRRGGTVVAQVVDHGGDDERTCKRFAHAAEDGARAGLHIMRVNPSGRVSYGANNDARV